jgi:molybdopterin-guanine dinucleotide biosynthesis protein A
MGQDKALVDVAGKPMIAWVVEALEAVCSKVAISGRDWEGRPGLDDHSDFKGPIAGLAAALRLGDDVLLVAVDQAWVRRETLAELARLEGSGVPVDVEQVPQVTCARYARDHPLQSFDGSLQSLVRPADLIDQSLWRTWGEDGRSWFSVDTPADIAVGLEMFGVPT